MSQAQTIKGSLTRTVTKIHRLKNFNRNVLLNHLETHSIFENPNSEFTIYSGKLSGFF